MYLVFRGANLSKSTDLHQNLDSFSSDELGIVGLLIANGPKKFVFITAVERRLPDQHLIQEDSERPPINTESVLQAFYYLKNKVK